jgi:hypothetical protein
MLNVLGLIKFTIQYNTMNDARCLIYSERLANKIKLQRIYLNLSQLANKH